MNSSRRGLANGFKLESLYKVPNTFCCSFARLRPSSGRAQHENNMKRLDRSNELRGNRRRDDISSQFPLGSHFHRSLALFARSGIWRRAVISRSFMVFSNESVSSGRCRTIRFLVC